MDEPCERCPCKAICLRYPAFCEWMADPEHPHHESRRRHICARSAMAPAPAYPSAATMAGNLAGAVVRVASAVVRGAAVMVPAEVYEERRAICAACPEWVAADRRCRVCGCHTDAKLRGAQEQCPLPEPRWSRWEEPTDGDRGDG